MSRLTLVLMAVVLYSGPVLAGFLDELSTAVDNVADDAEKLIDGTLVSEEAQAHDATEVDLWDQVRFQWGQYAGPDNVKLIKHDVTCDGGVDYVASRLNLDNPDGPFFDVLVVTRDGGSLISEGVSMSFDGSQAGLCAMPEGPNISQIEVQVEHWDEGQLDATLGSWEGICTEAIRVDDGMCDAPRYFWLTGDREEAHPRLMFYRN